MAAAARYAAMPAPAFGFQTEGGSLLAFVSHRIQKDKARVAHLYQCVSYAAHAPEPERASGEESLGAGSLFYAACACFASSSKQFILPSDLVSGSRSGER
ncbi:unnamed protein product [Urochloa humidicola]